MSGPRRLALLLVLLSLAAGYGVTRKADAQVPPTPSGAAVTGSMSASGSYTARVNTSSTPQFFERSGTYQASVTFTAAVSVTGVNLLTQSGSYQASGPFTATVSAPDVTPFVVTGTYTASGTFAAGTFTSGGQWAITTGGTASGSHSGGGTYNLAALTATANGQYDGAVTSSARGPFNIQGPYGGSGTFTVGVMRMVEREAALQVDALTDMVAGIGGLVAAGPVSGAALEMRQTSAPTAASAAGMFSGGSIAPAGVSIVSFTGTTAQLSAAGAAEKVLTVSATVSGKMLVYVIGAPAFVNADFNAAFPSGLNGTLVIVKT